nr:Ppx/GppA phosphatase family protein [Mesorhizobium sp.]
MTGEAFLPDAGSESGQHPKTRGKRRRKRRRGRKVFARDMAAPTSNVTVPVQAEVNQVQDVIAPEPEAVVQPPRRDVRRPQQNDLPVFAALDLGTNNCRLLVAVPGRPGQFRVIDAFSRIVRLGEGLAASGRLSDAAMGRAVEALKVCGDKLRTRKIENARLVATEACRAAANGEEFLTRVRSETGLELEIIDRQTEARLAVSGCGSLVERETDGVVLFDIGGGSSEIALIDVRGQRSPRLASHIVAWTSLPVGVVTLAERFGGREVTRETFAAMVDHVKSLLDGFVDRNRLDHVRQSTRFHLLGTSGTVTTLAGVHLDLERYDRRRVDGLWMDARSIDLMVERLLGWDFQQRVRNACIGADRADLVLAGCAILEAIRAEWPSERLRVADRGLREGILSELMGDAGVWRRGWRGSARP